jgi:hypothetical protein
MAIPSYTSANQESVVKEVQWVTEGNIITNPELYGVTPASAAFQGERAATLTWSHDPTLEETRKSGDLNRINQQLTKQIFTGTLVTKIVDDVTLKWAMNEAGGAGTMDESRTFVKSYMVDETETFEIATGCLPTRAILRLNNGAELILEVQMRAKDVSENQTADGGLTTPTWEATPLTGAPIKADDGGAGQFDYNSVDYAEAGMTIEVVHDLTLLEPSESLTPIHARAGMRSVSGSFDIQGRPDLVMRADQKAGTARALVRVISTSPSITATFTNAVLQNYASDPHDPTAGAVLVESINFQADDLVIA